MRLAILGFYKSMRIARLTALALALTLSGFPLGSLLCSAACAPQETQTAPACHGHGTGTGSGPVVHGIHLCDQDASVVPVIAQSTFALALVGTDTPYEAQSIGAVRVAPSPSVWMPPPGFHPSRVLTAEAVLRI